MEKASRRSTKRAGTARKMKRVAAKRATAQSKKAATKKAAVRHPEDDRDACDIDFAASEVTPDEALPPARGGVGIPGGKGRTRLR